jgi:hypothetical protein
MWRAGTKVGKLCGDCHYRASGLVQFLLCLYKHNRKAWLFCDSQSGAKASTNLYSLVESAKANGKEPHAYLTHLYEKLPLAKTVDDIEALLPWNVDLSKQQ